MQASPIVIVGSGMAGYAALRELRKRDAEVPVTLVTADDGRVYNKPNLSNALVQKRQPAQLALETAAQAASRYHATLLAGNRVRRIDPAGKRLTTDQGEIAYARLVLALGADPVAHGLEGAAAGAVLSVNDLADYTRFRERLEGKGSVAILGGGLIGCEFANDLALAGIRVDVVHRGGYPLERLMPAAAGQALASALAAKGVTWHFGRTAQGVTGGAEGYTLTLDDGTALSADLVLSAIGLRPRTALARAAGLVVNRGIVVDRQLLSSVPDVYAVGDCAEVAGLVLPYVHPLLIQAKVLAATLSGEPTAVSYPAMAVVVKTTSHPLSLLPPPPGAAGTWRVAVGEAGVCAEFVDAAGQLLGFALSGAESGKRMAYAQRAPALLA